MEWVPPGTRNLIGLFKRILDQRGRFRWTSGPSSRQFVVLTFCFQPLVIARVVECKLQRLRPSRFIERRKLGRKGWGWNFVCIQLVYNFNFVIDPIPFKNKIPAVSPLICGICSGTV